MIKGISVSELISEKVKDRLRLKVVAGKAGLKNKINTPLIQKPGLLLTGTVDKLHPHRVLIFGKAEVRYLKNLEEDALKPVLKLLDEANSPCYIVTRGLKAPEPLVRFAEREKIPLLRTTLTTSIFLDRFTKYLEGKLAPEATMHAVFVDILGVGILIIGKSGIGKSECALDLITRGHRLISDDIVIVKRMPPAIIMGMAVDVIKYHMEVRGLGIINVKDIFGITAIREKKQMDIVVELVAWNPEEGYERLGFDVGKYEILGVELPHLRIPVSPGRSVATIVEVAARNQILKIMGYDSALEFYKQLNDVIVKGRKG